MITQTTLRPGQKGTKGLAKKYGDRLVCVRYKYDENTQRRYTTVELIEDEIDWNPTPTPPNTRETISPERRLGVRVEYWESDIREKVKATGAIWRPRHKLWEMRYEDVVALGLEERVVGEQILEP
jgi:hypothetical protein